MLAVADKQKFSEWLEREIERRGLSQAELAREAKVTRAAINGVLTGARGPGKDLCLAIARAFKIPPEVVFQKAGLLPDRPEQDPTLDEINFKLSLLPKRDQEEALRYLNYLIEKSEREGRGASKNTDEGLEPAR
jgi:transcriptional regulator with XRE-family HTH domain